jgi:hypothetical protein
LRVSAVVRCSEMKQAAFFFHQGRDGKADSGRGGGVRHAEVGMVTDFRNGVAEISRIGKRR